MTSLTEDNQGSKPIWVPTKQHKETTQLGQFMASAPGAPANYAALHRWSIDETGEFWQKVWDDLCIIGTSGNIAFEPGAHMTSARFFPQGKLNFAENLLRCRGNGTAIVAKGEGAWPRELSWDDLYDQSSALHHWLKAQGVGPDDRVAAVLPNCPEAIILMLGASSVGATFSSCSPDFGEQGILDRFEQIEPRILVACDGYGYGGKKFDIRSKIESLCDKLPSVEHIIWVPYLGLDVPVADEKSIPWSQILIAHDGHDIVFEQLPFSHPLYVMFSSGTTGKPKCIVHSAGGTLLQHLKEHKLHADIRPGDRVFYFTTCGWMMWNWMVSGLASEATLLLYDGNPFYPDGNVLFDFAEGERATFFGVSAKYIDALKKQGFEPVKTHNLNRIRTIASTGSPLSPESFDYVYKSIKEDVNLTSISGGTDIVSCFVLGNPTLPVYRGEIQCAGLGMAVEIWDDEGARMISDRGELICRVAFPSMPIGFWNDVDGERYHAAYFNRFDNVWCHGDFAIETEHHGFVIVGRSDATLNPGGVRIGTAEIYRQVEQMDEILESIAIGQEWQDDARVILFVTLREGESLTDALTRDIKSRIRQGASPRHVPAKVIAVDDIPRTKSGKITELAVRDVVHGREVKNTQALANPEALDLFKDLAELKKD